MLNDRPVMCYTGVSQCVCPREKITISSTVMSRSTNCSFTCPCGTVFTSQIYEYVNVAQDPRLRYTVLAGLLNVSTCSHCGRRAALAQPFIYSDPDHRLLAYVHLSTSVPENTRPLILENLRA